MKFDLVSFAHSSRSLFVFKSRKSTCSLGLATFVYYRERPFSHNKGGFSTGYLFSQWLPWIILKLPTKRILHGFALLLPVLIFILELSCGWLGVFQRCFYIFLAHGLNFESGQRSRSSVLVHLKKGEKTFFKNLSTAKPSSQSNIVHP